MFALLLAAQAAPTVGGFGGIHLAGPNHELYDSRSYAHAPLGSSALVGLRLGAVVEDLVLLEAEAALGPNFGAGGLFSSTGAHIGVLAPFERFVPGILVGGGTIGIDGPTLGNDSDLAFHAGALGLLPLHPSWSLRGDVRYLLSGRVGEGGTAGHTAITVGLQFRPRPAEPDQDGDGVPDATDACPRDAELPNGYRDEDGCPDELAVLRIKVKDAEGNLVPNAEVELDGTFIGNTNRDGRLAIADLHPDRTVELVAKVGELHPIPLRTELREGDNRVELVVGWPPGTLRITAKNLGGTPIPADVWALGPVEEHWKLDAKGVSERVLPPGHYRVMLAADGYDAIIKLVNLPDEVGPRQHVDAVLRPQRVQLKGDAIVTLDPVLFARGSAKLAPASLGLIEAIAAVLVNHPEILKVEVAGHASAEGSTISNLELSQKRVEEVKRMLVARGVDPDRLVAKGYGESRPRADNSTTEGRRRNRRVEFHILQVREP